MFLTNQAKLPYRTGLIWSYCLEHKDIKDNFKLDGWYWYRDEKNTIENIFKKIKNPSLAAFMFCMELELEYADGRND